ncbi:MAG: hypothetical protein ACK448_11320 [Bacteroidota bacterium]|jgi:hypothetical protein
MLETIDNLERPFVELLGKEVRTTRFLWHVKRSCNSSDLSIACNGLRKPNDYAVFAHNRLPEFENMYPYFMDRWELDWDKLEIHGCQFECYSYWRIDTKIASVPWYIDPYCATQPGIDPPIHYLCTPNAIPREALKLFTFDLNCFLKRTPYIRYSEGAVHIAPICDDFDTLKPYPIYENMARKLAEISQHNNLLR